MQRVTIVTDTHHSVCLTHLLADTVESKIKLETALEANVGCIEQRGRHVERQRQMHRLTENDRMIEKSINAREW